MAALNFKHILEIDGGITSVATAPKESNNLYITKQRGLVLKYDLRTKKLKTILDITDTIKKLYEERPMMVKFPDERGLLRIVFHPEYNTSASLFKGVFITINSEIENPDKYDDLSKEEVPKPDHMTCISQYVYRKGNTPEQTRSSRIDILCVPEPQANHNGGGMLFGPDGYLWIGLGDGGGANDEHGYLLDENIKDSFIGSAQNLHSYNGKILRFGIVQPMPQKINLLVPHDNPFANDTEMGRPEIVAWGFRNPWSMSFDSIGRLFVGDVGQNRFESVKLVTDLGQNHGWRAMEGNEIFNNTVLKYIRDEIEENIIPPIITYPRESGIAIVGVQPYEGNNSLIIADYGGNIHRGYMSNDNTWKIDKIHTFDMHLTGLGVDANNEIYILAFDLKDFKGKILKLESVNTNSIPITTNVNKNTTSVIRKNNTSLTDSDIQKIVDNGVAKAKQVKSGLRKTKTGAKTNVKMHFAVIRTGDSQATLVHSMPDAWQGSIDIAKRKAYTAYAFSSNQNALTTRTVGILSQPGSPLWQIGNSNPDGGIIEFPGGIPLYKNNILVGAVGVSGDGVDNDELVAIASSSGFEPTPKIRSDISANIPYVKSEE